MTLGSKLCTTGLGVRRVMYWENIVQIRDLYMLTHCPPFCFILTPEFELRWFAAMDWLYYLRMQLCLHIALNKNLSLSAHLSIVFE